MDFQRVTAAGDPLYAPAMELYRASFPPHEQRQRASQKSILSHPDYHFLVLTEQDAAAGILLTWDTARFRYVEHFAVSPTLRGRSFGSRALQAWADGADTPVILEIDPLTTDIAVRRKGLYERLGFTVNPFPHMHPLITTALPDMRCWCCPGRRRWRKTLIRHSRSTCAP